MAVERDSLRFSLRLASRDVDYPLPIEGAAEWSVADSVTVEVPLPAVPKDHIIVPSFASLDCPAAFRFELGEAHTSWFGPHDELEGTARAHSTKAISTPVDYFEYRDAVAGTGAEARAEALTLRIAADAPPERYLIAVTIRPTHQEIEAGNAPSLPSPTLSPPAPLPRLSQLDAPENIRHAICSPTSAAMMLKGRGMRASEADVTAMSKHPPSGLYGVWPQNMWAAARCGLLGAAEAMSDWWQILDLLRTTPLVASIRFGPGELEGAPLEKTAGHLVVVRGIEDGRVVVHDPAAPLQEVERRYDIDQFARAWLSHRGVAYVFANAYA